LFGTQLQRNAAPPNQRIAGANQQKWEIHVGSRASSIPPSLLIRVKASGLLWSGKKIKEEHKHYIENKMTPANLRRWGTYSAALTELAGCDARMVKEVLRGRFGSARGTRGKPKQLVPLPVGLTVEAVGKMITDAARKAHSAYIGPIKKGALTVSLRMLREALTRAINSRA
jgi:hypothetical protein